MFNYDRYLTIGPYYSASFTCMSYSYTISSLIKTFKVRRFSFKTFFAISIISFMNQDFYQNTSMSFFFLFKTYMLQCTYNYKIRMQLHYTPPGFSHKFILYKERTTTQSYFIMTFEIVWIPLISWIYRVKTKLNSFHTYELIISSKQVLNIHTWLIYEYSTIRVYHKSWCSVF